MNDSPSNPPLIAMLTDFGLQDWFVGTMKGVIKGICRRAEIIDVCHGVAAQSIQDGSTILAASHMYFPRDTIFLAIVDPGVGSTREGVIVRACDQYFVAPNNGLLSFLIRRADSLECRRITNENYFLGTPGSTFHGRDVFAPCAAHLANGVDWRKIAAFPTELIGLPVSAASFDDGIIEGNIVYFDHFGNAITNIALALYQRAFEIEEAEVALGTRVIGPIASTYADVPVGSVLAYWGSTGHLEIGINRGNARAQLNMKLLDKVVVRRLPAA